MSISGSNPSGKSTISFLFIVPRTQERLAQSSSSELVAASVTEANTASVGWVGLSSHTPGMSLCSLSTCPAWPSWHPRAVLLFTHSSGLQESSWKKPGRSYIAFWDKGWVINHTGLGSFKQEKHKFYLRMGGMSRLHSGMSTWLGEEL